MKLELSFILIISEHYCDDFVSLLKEHGTILPLAYVFYTPNHFDPQNKCVEFYIDIPWILICGTKIWSSDVTSIVLFHIPILGMTLLFSNITQTEVNLKVNFQDDNVPSIGSHIGTNLAHCSWPNTNCPYV